MIRGTTLSALVVVLGLACVFGKGTDTEKGQESTSLLLDMGPPNEEKKDVPVDYPRRQRKRPKHRPIHKPCSTSRPAGGNWVNEWHGRLFFVCPKGQTITYMKSNFSDCQKDRVWEFGCGYNEASKEYCHWSPGFVNEKKQSMFFNCPNHGFISGIDSIYVSARVGDRRYKFLCCNDERFDHEDCRQSHHLNSAGENFDFKVDRDRRFYITGISSCFDSEKKDRVWVIDYCKSVKEEGTT